MYDYTAQFGDDSTARYHYHCAVYMACRYDFKRGRVYREWIKAPGKAGQFLSGGADFFWSILLNHVLQTTPADA